MSHLAIILIVIAVIVVLLFIGGIVAVRRRSELGAASYAEHLTEADQALEAARADDRGWDRVLLEAAVAEALGASHPGVEFHRMELVLVDDRPGVHEDTAHFEAVGADGRVRVVLSRGEGGWRGETVA